MNETSVPISDEMTPEPTPPGRLRLILQRLARGFYDRPDVLRATAGKVASELDSPDDALRDSLQ